MQERINRVIENHLMSCQHIGKYLYILRGFDFIKDRVTIPVAHYTSKHQERDAIYMFEEEMKDLDMNQFSSYDLITVTFNFFEEGFLGKDKTFIKPQDLDLKVSEELNIFNTINPLIGVVDDLTLDDAAKFVYLDSIL